MASPIRFKLEYRTVSVHFLDLNIFKVDEEGTTRFGTSLYTKPTDCNSLLDARSFHPLHQKKGILTSQLTRVIRNNSELPMLQQQLEEMDAKLVERGYTKEMVKKARDDLMDPTKLGMRQRTTKSDPEQINMVTTYTPDSRHLTEAVRRHWPVSVFDIDLSFTEPKVISCDWHSSINKAAHRTHLYDSNDVILRRGQPFIATLNFNKALQPGQNIVFTCETGPSPAEETKTKAIFPLFRAQDKSSWSAVLTSSASNSLTVNITSPPNAVIGRYIFKIAVSANDSDKKSTQHLGGMYLLFNPWCQEDDVFMAEEDKKQEYILSEFGIQYIGSDQEMSVINWDFNQFDIQMLEICFAILDRSLNYQKDPVLDVSQRHDPVYVCRVLTATVNGRDENGVLVENWSGNYKDGVSPATWNGSVNILKQWYFTGFKPVKYGQCWVFGGVLCTVLRCLGIPTRVITNFNSAQDRNGNLFLDSYYDSHGNSTDTEKDLIWNFHVWNEAWLVRKDLGPKYNGWQAMDGTPLETSDGVYRCGPAPVVAIKEGDVDINYDVRFMFASVNADIANWIVYSDGSKKRISNDTKYIGKLISTKAVLKFEREDVTDSYKYPEGSDNERHVFEKAVNKLYERPMADLEKNLLNFPRRISEKSPQGTILSGDFTITNVPTVGQDVSLILRLKNLIKNQIKITVNLNSSSILYTGRRWRALWADAKIISLGPEEEKHISIPVTYAQYGKYLSEENMIRVTALCEVEGSEERILLERDITLAKPPISIKLPDEAVLKTTFDAEVTIVNTLSETLNECYLVVEGNGLIERVFTKELPPLKPGDKYELHIAVTPFKKGLRTLLVAFTCDKIQNVKGSHRVMVI
ncbi:protein-glutamine gamma-glutamyltransferase E-like [Bombina bombina]|uniref:protein-glutamine gamma-glutamyltransferase E-like n=1 Tax=Bombina bombina TaxID=8345 RepID=UPI00235B2E90|nr:protein-glutamine gamma-glutamyltransferase E-like [Bombina bombina]